MSKQKFPKGRMWEPCVDDDDNVEEVCYSGEHVTIECFIGPRNKRCVHIDGVSLDRGLMGTGRLVKRDIRAILDALMWLDPKTVKEWFDAQSR